MKLPTIVFNINKKQKAEKERKKKWDIRMMKASKHIGTWSKDLSTKVGCVIVNDENRIIATGYNGFPAGVHEDEERFFRPLKYKYTEHSERNAFYYAAKEGIALKGCTLYVDWIPCADCARGIIGVGLKRVVIEDPNHNFERWGEDFKITLTMLKEAGIEVEVFNEFDKEIWKGFDTKGYNGDSGEF